MKNDRICVLVVGGCGYIGSHMVKMLRGLGLRVHVLDDLSSGAAWAVHEGELTIGDMADQALLNRVFAEQKPTAVMHFASFIQVGESVQNPAKYYQNNFVATKALLDAMLSHEVKRFIFSSTAAIFGNPVYTPINEAHPTDPINPYGRIKLMVEQMLADYDRAYGLKSICLRYFNAAGADPDGELGECHEPETHLIPLILEVASGRRSHITVYGDDYPTEDGTCIRDYIHIVDLCAAHHAALLHLNAGGDSAQFNLGNGSGFSVNQVIEAVRRVTGNPIDVRNGERREGDPPVLVADAAAARAKLNWAPKYADLDTIIRHAWRWEQEHHAQGSVARAR